MKISRIAVCCAIFGSFSCTLWAQEDKREVRKGNSDFGKANYKEAEIHYRKAMVKDSTSFVAIYDLANTLYAQKDYEGAKNVFDKIADQANESIYGDRYFFNKGNTSLQQKDYAGALEDFKQSLLRNPDDIQAKESYLYAKKMLEKEQNKNPENNDKQQQEKNDNPQEQNQDQDNKPEEQEQQGGDSSQQEISAQQAQQMLRAIQAKEKETQEKVEKAKAQKAKTRQKEKNW